MLDIKGIRKNPEAIQKNFDLRRLNKERTGIASVGEILKLDENKLEIQTRLENARAEKNFMSKQLSERKKHGLGFEDLISGIKSASDRIKVLEAEFEYYSEKLYDKMTGLPNLLDEDTPCRKKVIREYKQKPILEYEAKGHYELCRLHGLVDFNTAARLIGSGYWIYSGVGAKLEWALINYCLESNQRAGYEMLMVPPIANDGCGFGAGQFPKFSKEVYRIEGDSCFLIPTAETLLVNLHSDEILKYDELPLKYTSFTPCFRRENSSNKDEKGIVRGHQFNKAELVQFVCADKASSDSAFEELLSHVESLVKGLGLHYRVVRLPGNEVGYSMAKTVDVEVYFPSIDDYKEVSSVSNAGDYQSRRNNTRYRDSNGKLCFTHTLNGSGLATSRLFAALLEQNQLKDGHIVIPDVLSKYTGVSVI